MLIKFYNTDENAIIAKTMLAPWDYYIKEKACGMMIVDIYSSCVNEALFIDLDEANIDYQIISDNEERAFDSALETLRESIAKLSKTIEKSFVISTAYADALKTITEEVEDCGE